MEEKTFPDVGAMISKQAQVPDSGLGPLLACTVREAKGVELMEPEAGPSPNEMAHQRTGMAVDRTGMAVTRTLLAWVRTGLTMNGFGFTIYKFLDAFVGQGVREGAAWDSQYSSC